jgi:hypothetical protein
VFLDIPREISTYLIRPKLKPSKLHRKPLTLLKTLKTKEETLLKISLAR